MPIRAKRQDGKTDPGLTMLKVNVKSLAEEAKIIRLEARKARARNRPNLAVQLNDHRRDKLRKEARASHLAYAFLKGRDYKQVEAKCHEPPNWARVRDKVLSFGATRDYEEPRSVHDARRDALDAQLKEWKL